MTTRHIGVARTAEDSGSWHDALAAYEAALYVARANGSRSTEAQLLRTIGRVLADRGEHDRARDAFEACLAIAEETGEHALAATALNALAAIAQFRGDVDLAEGLFARARGLAQELGDVRMCALVDQNLGKLANIRGDLRSAIVRYEAALDRFRALRDHRASAQVLNHMGMLQMDVGEFAEAEFSFGFACQLAEKHEDFVNQGRIETNRADLYLRQQKFEHAREHCERALRLFTQLSSDNGLADTHRMFGVLYRETGKAQLATTHLALALRLARGRNSRLSEAETESECARLFLEEGQYGPALISLNRAHEIFRNLEGGKEIVDAGRRLERLVGPYFEAVQLWTSQEPLLREQRTAARGARVAALAMRLMRGLGREDMLFNARIAAFVHDIGMAGTQREIAFKIGALTFAERAIIEKHTVNGERLLRELNFAPDICAAVRHHHEAWDGSGYPDGLAGEQIPLLARVLGLVDAYDALVSARPFRPALTPDQALMVLRREAEHKFDPGLWLLFPPIIHDPTTYDTPTTLDS